MAKINSIPYISQWDSEAQQSKNDCGPVSLTMVLRGYGEQHRADSIFTMTGAGQGYVSFQMLMNVAHSLGYQTEYRDRQSFEYLKSLIDRGLTPIVLVQYAKLKSVQDTQFKGPHICVMTGYKDDGVFIHDPNFWGEYREHGNNHFYTNDEFLSAWSATTTNGNTPCTFMIVYPKNNTNQPNHPPSSDQDKKDIESMKKLREYNNVWYEAKHIIADYEALKDERNRLGKEISDKDKEIKKRQKEAESWKEKYDTLELNIQTTIDVEVKKKSIDCDASLAKLKNDLLLEHADELNDLREKIAELENREPTKIVHIETPLTERYAKRPILDRIVAIIEILSTIK